MNILSLGAGVQSSTLLLMGCEGLLDIDAAIFADTQWEPRAVYAHLEWLKHFAQSAEHPIPVHTVTQGNLRQDALDGEPKAWMPLYNVDQRGKRHMLKRQCTSNYKLTPIHRKLRELMKERGEKRVDLLIGISLDEFARMKPSRVKYITHHWPLIDQRMSRVDCLRWLETHNYPIPPKSSCCGCPYRDNTAWRTMRDQSPEDFQDAVDFDNAIRDTQRADGQSFIHRSFIPLSAVDLRSPQERGQLDMFTEECYGLCGV